MASTRNGHCTGTAGLIHSYNHFRLLPQAAHLEPKQLHQQSDGDLLHHEKNFNFLSEQRQWDEPGLQYVKLLCCGRNERAFAMWAPQDIHTSETAALSRRLLFVVFSLPPFLIFSTVDHVQIDVTHEKGQ